jgi:hypothetical protein
MIEIFFSYAHADEDMMNDVRRQLVIYERNGQILKWHDRKIPPGDEWKDQIDQRLNAAQIILLFVSPHFIESKYCYEIEGKTALRRHKAGTARVIPVILRPCPWNEAPFSKLEALPRDGKPISRWSDRDEACLDVASGVMAVVDELASWQGLKGNLKPKTVVRKTSSQKSLASSRKGRNKAPQALKHKAGRR